MWERNSGFYLGCKVQSIYQLFENNFFVFQTVELSILSLVSEYQYRENHVKISPKFEAISTVLIENLGAPGNSLTVLWLGLRASAEGGSIPASIQVPSLVRELRSQELSSSMRKNNNNNNNQGTPNSKLCRQKMDLFVSFMSFPFKWIFMWCSEWLC